MLDLCKCYFRSFQACRNFDSTDRNDCTWEGLLQIPERSCAKCEYVYGFVSFDILEFCAIVYISFCPDTEVKQMIDALHFQLAAKVEVIRDEFIRFAVEKCTSILKENHAAVEAITGSVQLSNN